MYRRITTIAIAAGSRILHADHQDTLAATGLTLAAIYSSTDYGACHALVDYAKRRGDVAAIVTLSNGGRSNHKTVAVLPEHIARVTAMVDCWEGSLNLLEDGFP